MTKLIKKTDALPTVQLKQVLLLDVGDGAFIDHSVKIKPHKTNPHKLAIKCTNGPRLLKALQALGLKPCGAPIKGTKHYIVIVWKSAFDAAMLEAQTKAMGLEANNTATAVPAKQLSTTKGVK